METKKKRDEKYLSLIILFFAPKSEKMKFLPLHVVTVFTAKEAKEEKKKICIYLEVISSYKRDVCARERRQKAAKR